ncbi:GtrA family protein [Pedobacter sp. MC2016-14]|uniref:GtrA family protein n=1 Tax=Pedobacter sp. MC2016-14 TaxID=2897327 RepID=UPI001E2A4E0E|nr:GtrA family protein [Pedobacter sp. MC2016-14]MCD0488470.1 GtrA family protein [Pedobacter sp. MC2016-14]
MRKVLLKFIDFFYPPFSGLLSLHTFRYIVSGGTNAASGIVLYFLIYNYVLHQKDVYIPFKPGMITAHVATLIIETPLTFLIGFMLNKYVVFTQSELKGRIQMFRYALVVGANLMLNYGMIKIMVESFDFYPTISKIITTVVLAVASYFIQTHFSFKVKK